MLERDVESAIVKYAEDRGCISIKLNGPHDRGKPDRAFFYKGRCIVIEMKKPGEKPTPLQQKWLEKFSALGFTAVCRDNIGKGKSTIDQFMADADRESKLLKAVILFVRKFRKLRWGHDGDCGSVSLLEPVEELLPENDDL